MLSELSIIKDISHIAHTLNQSTLSQREYLQNGGAYGPDIFQEDFGSVANFCELAGVKCKRD